MFKNKRNKKRVKSQSWLDLLTGEKVEKAALRDEQKSSISYAIYKRKKDKDGAEYLQEVEKW